MKTEEIELLKKQKTNHMLIEIGYKKIILPFDAGNKLVGLMQYAEQASGYGDEFKVHPVEKDIMTVHIVSEQEYLAGKMCHLLGAPVDPSIMETLRVTEVVSNEE